MNATTAKQKSQIYQRTTKKKTFSYYTPQNDGIYIFVKFSELPQYDNVSVSFRGHKVIFGSLFRIRNRPGQIDDAARTKIKFDKKKLKKN